MLATALAITDDATEGLQSSSRASQPTPICGLSALLGIARIFEAKEHIFRDGDRAGHVYRIEAGHVCIYRTMPDGRRQVIDFAYPGDMIGLGAIGQHTANAQASSKVRLRCIPISVLKEQARRDPRFGIELYEAVSLELNAARELLFTVSQRSAVERLAAFLVALSRRAARRGDNPREIVLPMTRTDIGDFLGLTIETVSRMFTKLKAEGLIGVEQCILVTINDAPALTRLADGEGSDGA